MKTWIRYDPVSPVSDRRIRNSSGHEAIARALAATHTTDSQGVSCHVDFTGYQPFLRARKVEIYQQKELKHVKNLDPDSLLIVTDSLLKCGYLATQIDVLPNVNHATGVVI